MSSSRDRQLCRAPARGAVAGLVGVAVMTVVEKAEQALSGRPISYVPARAAAVPGRRRPTPPDPPTEGACRPCATTSIATPHG